MKIRAGRTNTSASSRMLAFIILGIALLLMTFCFVMAAMPTKAATGYDGTYDFTCSAMVPNPNTNTHDYVTYTAPGFLIISNGQISDAKAATRCPSTKQPTPSPPAPVGGVDWCPFTGSVDSNGNANWQGGSTIACTNLDYTYIGVIKSDGTGSGTFSRFHGEHGTWSVNITGGSLGGLGVGGLSPASAPLVGLTALGAAAGLGASLMPPPHIHPPQIHHNPGRVAQFGPSHQAQSYQAPSYQAPPHQAPVYQQGGASESTMTNVGSGSPEQGQYVGGAGLTAGYADPTIWKGPGPPPPPSDWYNQVSQNPPQCPFNLGIRMVAHYQHSGDPGSWFCPRCQVYHWR